MSHQAVATRIRAEYLEMPGLRLTLEQAQRLCGVERVLCKMALDVLVDERFLSVKPGGTYGRAADGDAPRTYPAKAALRIEPRARIVS